MSDNFDSKMRGIYGWTVEGGKAVPPLHRFPKEVKDRLDYFAEMMEDGLSLYGCLECVFSETEPDDYWLGATKDWLPQDDIFKKWVGTTENMAWTEAIIYLLYGNWTDVLEGQTELELGIEEHPITFGDEIKSIRETNHLKTVELSEAVRKHLNQHGPVKGLRFDQVNVLTIMCEWGHITFGKQLEDTYRQVMRELIEEVE